MMHRNLSLWIAILGQVGASLSLNPYVIRTVFLYVVVADDRKAYFNVMLREMGVKGVKIQEVFALDDDMLAILPSVVPTLPLCLL